MSTAQLHTGVEILMTRELVNAFHTAAKVSPVRSKTPILTSIKVTIRRDLLVIEATDLTTYYRAEIVEQGVLHNSEFSVQLDRSDAAKLRTSSHLILGPNSYTLDGVRSAPLHFAEFPAFPFFESKYVLARDCVYIAELTAAARIASKSETRPMLTGICHRDESMIATDSFRVFEVKTDPWPQSFVLPASASVPLFHAFSGHTGSFPPDSNLQIEYDERWARFSRGPQQIVVRLLEGTYPDVNRIWPSSSTSCAFVLNSDVGAWLRACEAVMRVHLKPAKKNRDIHLSTTLAFTKEGCLISAQNESSGSFSDPLPCLFTGPDLTVQVNAQYLADAMLYLKGSSGILFSFRSSNDLFTLTNDDGIRRALINPIRQVAE